MLRVYEPEFVPDVCGLVNTGVICYLNTMLQMLFSCSSFNHHMLENKELFSKAAASGNKIGLLYIRLLEENNIRLRGDGKVVRMPNPFEVKQCSGSILLRELIDLRKRNKSTSNLLHHHQEDLHEGLTFFIETLTKIDESVADVFNIRYKMDIRCRKCKDIKEGPREKPNIMFQLFEEDPILQDALDSKTKIEDYIKQHINIPDDYKCDKCGAINTVVNKQVTPNIQQIYRLARISSVIILVFNKYEEKKLKFFPDSLDFKSTNGDLHYELISQVEHYGNKGGGHYLTKCRRPTPEKFNEFVASKKNKGLKAELDGLNHRKGLLTHKIKVEEKSTGIADANLINSLKTVESKIAKITSAMEGLPDFGKDVTFHLNDSSVSVDPNGMAPTRNTYVAIYHMV